MSRRYSFPDRERGHVYAFSHLVPLLQFAHLSGAHDVYWWAARALEGYHITRRPPWRTPEYLHANPGPPDPDRALCANNRLHITEKNVYSSELANIAGYPLPDHAFTVDLSPETLVYDDYKDLDDFCWEHRISRAEAIHVLEMVIDAGIDVAFFPGALGSVVISGTLSVDEKARLMKSEKGDAKAIVDSVQWTPDGRDDSQGVLGPGGQLVKRLNQALNFWEYCTRLEGETTYGMLGSVIRVLWPAPWVTETHSHILRANGKEQQRR